MTSPAILGPDVRNLGAAFIEPTARIYGAVEISAGASIWGNAVIRAECQRVVIGPRSNVQDFVMIHIGMDAPTIIGANCSITHHVTLHGCTIEDDCLIGIGATVMDRCVIGKGSIVAGGSFLTEGTVIPPHSIVMGSPGKVARTRDNTRANRVNALLYHRNALAYAAGDYRAWSRPELLADVVAEAHRESEAT